MYGNDDGSIPATYQILYMIGWKPSDKQVRLFFEIIVSVRSKVSHINDCVVRNMNYKSRLASRSTAQQ